MLWYIGIFGIFFHARKASYTAKVQNDKKHHKCVIKSVYTTRALYSKSSIA